MTFEKFTLEIFTLEKFYLRENLIWKCCPVLPGVARRCLPLPGVARWFWPSEFLDFLWETFSVTNKKQQKISRHKNDFKTFTLEIFFKVIFMT